MAYTYDDFLKELNRTGAKLSDADMETAKKHPEFGISLISLGEDFNKATTPEQKALAHNAAEELRKSYGGYYGGMDGSGYIAVPEQQKTGGVQTPEYTNRYAEQQKQLLDELMNREDFSYDKENDPNWGSFKKSYLREGERASANALAQASAASGGRPSTYAMTAAGQAGDYYASKLNDMIPALEQQAYDRYADEGNRILHKLESVNVQEQMDYAKHLNEANRADTFYARELAELERGRQEDEQKRKFAQEQVDAILAAGGTPSEQLVADSGYSTEYVSALAAAMAAQKAAGTGAGSGAGYNNGTLTSEQVKLLQNALGVNADGFYGPASQAAAGGIDADTAWALLVGDGNPPKDPDAPGTGATSAGYNSVKATLDRAPGLTQLNKVNIIEDAYNNGRLTDAEVNQLLDHIGYGEV